MPPKTRHVSGSSLEEVLGTPEELNESELPTLRAVLRHGLYLQVILVVDVKVYSL